MSGGFFRARDEFDQLAAIFGRGPLHVAAKIFRDVELNDFCHARPPQAASPVWPILVNTLEGKKSQAWCGEKHSAFSTQQLARALGSQLTVFPSSRNEHDKDGAIGTRRMIQGDQA